MAVIAPAAKMKRKDLEDVFDEFSEFSLSAPARKIRRLDAELPPIMEDLVVPGLGFPMGACPPVNEERALVLYKPVMSNPSLHSRLGPNSYKLSSPEILSGLKNQAFWQGNANPVNLTGDRASNCLAVVPWQAPVSVHATGESEQRGDDEPMDAEVALMEIEDQGGNEGFHQWPQQQQQQQHCMTPQSPSNTPTPIMWSW